MDTDLRQNILEANLDLHREEAELYDRIHQELTNRGEKERLRRLLDSAMQNLPTSAPKVALDVGAGTGSVTGELLKRGFKVQAVDISAEMLGMLSAKFVSDVKEGKVVVTVKDADSFLEKTTDIYTVIAISSVLHHLPDYGATLKVLADRLVPGGALVIFHEPTGGELSGFEERLQKLDWKIAWNFLTSKEDSKLFRSKKLNYAMADYHVTHGFDEEKVKEVLVGAGLRVQVFERYATAKTGLVRFLLTILGKKRTWCMVARKSA